MLLRWLTSQEGFNIKWLQVFRTSLNNATKLNSESAKKKNQWQSFKKKRNIMTEHSLFILFVLRIVEISHAKTKGESNCVIVHMKNI